STQKCRPAETGMMLSRRTIQVIADCMSETGEVELCGFLLLDSTGEQRFHRISNLLGDRGSFFVSVLDFERLQRYAERHKLHVAAFIHSHRSSLDLSRADRTGMELSPLPWIVVAAGKSGLEFAIYDAPKSQATLVSGHLTSPVIESV